VYHLARKANFQYNFDAVILLTTKKNGKSFP